MLPHSHSALECMGVIAVQEETREDSVALVTAFPLPGDSFPFLRTLLTRVYLFTFHILFHVGECITVLTECIWRHLRIQVGAGRSVEIWRKLDAFQRGKLLLSSSEYFSGSRPVF